MTGEKFESRSISTMQEYFNSLQLSNEGMREVIVLFEKKEAAYVNNSKHYFGHVSEEETDEQIRMKFMTADLKMMARWLLSYGRGIEIEGPDELKDIMRGIVEELQEHYLKLV